nr:hypothetical protein [Burkholderia territorii]
MDVPLAVAPAPIDVEPSPATDALAGAYVPLLTVIYGSSAAAIAAFICARLTASFACVPAATLTIWRRAFAEPTDTVLARSATDDLPNATELATLAVAARPSAVAESAVALAPTPAARDSHPVAAEIVPSATPLIPVATAPPPSATVDRALAVAAAPIAVAPSPPTAGLAGAYTPVPILIYVSSSAAIVPIESVLIVAIGISDFAPVIGV